MHIQQMTPTRVLCGVAFTFASAALFVGCDSGGGGSSGRFVPNDTKVEQINGMSPSEAFHKNDKKRR